MPGGETSFNLALSKILCLPRTKKWRRSDSVFLIISQFRFSFRASFYLLRNASLSSGPSCLHRKIPAEPIKVPGFFLQIEVDMGFRNSVSYFRSKINRDFFFAALETAAAFGLGEDQK